MSRRRPVTNPRELPGLDVAAGKSIKEMGPMAILKRTGSVLFMGAAIAAVIGVTETE
jgi:hypothetical protein